MNITITNIVALNGGDAAILLGIIRELQKTFGSDIRLNVFCTYPEVCKEIFPDINWYETLGVAADRTRFNNRRIIGKLARILKRNKFYVSAQLLRFGIDVGKFLLTKQESNNLRIYKNSDLVISTGGTYLIEPYGITTQYIDYKITLILKKNLYFYTQSMGPFYKKDTRQKLSKIFNNKLVKLMLFRDDKSYNYAKSLLKQPRTLLKIVPDAAFSLGDKSVVEERINDSIGDKKKIAISVRKWENFGKRSSKDVMHRYTRCFAHLTMDLIRQGNEVYFFSTCQGIKEYDDDTIIVQEILELIPVEYHHYITSITRHLSIDEIRDLLNQMDFTVATRLHMCILSLISGTPVYPISYEFKTKELFKKLGYDRVIDMQDIEQEGLIEDVRKFIGNYDVERREYVISKVVEFITDSGSVSEILKQIK